MSFPVASSADVSERRATNAGAASSREQLIVGARAMVLIGLAILTASAVGLATHQAFSVSLWPANALLAGLMVRNPWLRCWPSWVGALAGFIATDLMFGRPLSLAVMFAITNVVGAMVATMFLMRLDPRDLALQRVHSVLRIVMSLLPACLAAGLCGAALVVIAFNGSPAQALLTWPAGELVNYLVVLPAILNMPVRRGHAAAIAGLHPRFDQAALAAAPAGGVVHRHGALRWAGQHHVSHAGAAAVCPGL